MNQDPRIQDAFRKAIKAYFEDNELTEYNKTAGDRKFGKKYFDTLESELTGDPKDKEVEKLKEKKSTKKSTPANKSNQLRVK